MFSVELECGDCGWRTVCGEAEVVRRLRALGLFRRASDPPEEIVREVLRSHGSQLTCDACGASGLIVRPDISGADDEWEQVVVCEICRQPIPAERLEFNPRATRCATCQDAADRGQSFVEPEFCPKCGSLLELRVSRAGGMTRYKMWCTGNPPCRL
jgi:Zn finger protein HypA/HybF involved in hydrogenase expression